MTIAISIAPRAIRRALWVLDALANRGNGPLRCDQSLPRRPARDRDAGSRTSAMIGKFFHIKTQTADPLVRWFGLDRFFDEGSRLLQRPPESRGHRRRIRRRVVGTVLLVFGILVWVMTATLPFTAYYARLVLRGHIELLSVGVVVGGALVSAGIIQIGTSLVRRRR
jgi:hypothetical protein